MNALVQFQPPRLPFHPVIEERFGIDKTGWKAIVEAIWPAADSVDSIVMALAYCKARNLDPFKRVVHIVPVWSQKLGRMVETVWPGIAELRTTAMRTGQYAGREKTAFGPLITEKLSGVEMTFPEWAQVTLFKTVAGAGVCRFEGPEVYWLETYATAKRDTQAPNAMWRKRPRGQIDKCAEAAALRTAFPEELGNEYAAEEMEGKAIDGNGAPLSVTDKVKPRKLHAGFDAPEPVAETVVEVEDVDAEIEHEPDPDAGPPEAPMEAYEPEPMSDSQEPQEAAHEAPAAASEPSGLEPQIDIAKWADDLRSRITDMTDADEVRSTWASAKTSGMAERYKAHDAKAYERLVNDVNAKLGWLKGRGK